MKYIVSMIFVLMWLAGIVIAKGFWSTFFAIVVPFWSYYLVVEQVVIKYIL
jgi:hypothetical protein